MNNHDRNLFQSAQDAFKRRDYDSAERILHHLTEEDAPFADAYSLLGVINYKQGYFTKAIAHLEKAISINPNYSEALMYLSVLLHDLGRYNKGKKHEEKLSTLPKGVGPKRLAPPFRAKLANMHADVGDLYRGLGCHLEAKTQYEQALSLEPHYPDIRLKHILCLRSLDKESREVIHELQKLIKESPRYTLAHLELGTTYYMQKSWSLAKAAWGKALRIDPKNENAGVYLKLLDHKVAARHSTKAAIAKHPAKPK